MTVKELIAKLDEHDPEHQVLFEVHNCGDTKFEYPQCMRYIGSCNFINSTLTFKIKEI